MLKKVVNYEDFDGNQRTETHWFNLNRVELTEMAINLPDDVSDAIGDDPSKVDEEKAALRIVGCLGKQGVLDFIKELIKKSYGVKSEDGKRFNKSPELFQEFSETLAYESIMMEFMTDQKAAAEFVNGVITSSANKAVQLSNKQ